tara:strand:+ start:1162 stop:2433 length:1272 start_codon:yes stop_codon:yes gene_type:complete
MIDLKIDNFLTKNMPPSSLEIAKKIVEKLRKQGYVAYFAGGWVRDYIMDHPSDDIDIATNATVKEVEELFEKTIPVGVQFGIIIVVEKNHHFEIASFRKEEGYKDGRRPTHITYANAKEDAKRRDFTINGMFYDPVNKKILDYVEGQEDIRKGLVRAIGNPHERFLEDRLRMIRAVRYASRFHFQIETKTLKAILDHAGALFPAVAKERIWHEFLKMANYKHFDLALITLHKLNLLPVIFPSLKEVDINAIEQRVCYIEQFPKQAPVIAKILELFPGSLLEEKKGLCNMLKLSNDEHRFVEFYHSAQNVLLFEVDQEKELFQWAHFYAHPFYSVCFNICALRIPEGNNEKQVHRKREQLLSWAIEKIKRKSPFLSSDALRKEGIGNGIKMGQLLKEGEKIAINQHLKSEESIINILKKHPLWT